MFGLKMTATEGKGQLVLDFVDTHSARPPKMEIKINDISFVRELPRGAGDASAHGQPYLVRRNDGKMYQPVLVSVLHIGEQTEAEVIVNGAELGKHEDMDELRDFDL